MNESETRRKKIDPALYGVGWEQVPELEILTEQMTSEKKDIFSIDEFYDII